MTEIPLRVFFLFFSFEIFKQIESIISLINRN